MAIPTPPATEPQQFSAGDLVQWTKAPGLYPSTDGWTLKYSLKGPGATAVTDVTAGVDAGGNYTITLPAAETASITAGLWRLFGFVTNGGGDRHTVYAGYVTVLPNVATTAFASLQSDNELILAAIIAAIKGRTTADMEHYQIDGTQIMKIPINELAKLRGIYAGKVWRERNRGRLSPQVALQYTTPGAAPSNANATDGQWPGPS